MIKRRIIRLAIKWLKKELQDKSIMNSWTRMSRLGIADIMVNEKTNEKMLILE